MKGADLIVGGEIVLYGMVMDHASAACWDDGFSGRMVREAMSATTGPVTIRMNSYGGVASEGEAIRAALAQHPEPVTIIIEGMCASAASLAAMGASRRVMTAGSLLMIHDPAGMSWGTEEDLTREAAVLGKMAAAYAEVYAAASGKTPEEVRDLMKAETWYSAEEAVAEGFADEVIPAREPQEEMTMQAARRVMTARRDEFARKREAVATPRIAALGGAGRDAQEQERSMSKDIITPVDTGTPELIKAPEMKIDPKAVLAADKSRRMAIRSLAKPFMAAGQVMPEEVEEMEDDEETTVEMARDKILTMLASRQSPETGRPGARAQVMADGVDRTREGMTKALMARVQLDGGERNEFSGMTLREMARETLRARNVRAPASVVDMVGAAFVPSMAGGYHTTSDFANVLADVANKSMLKGFEETEETFERFTSVGTLTDFKPTKRVGLDMFPVLDKVLEDAEFTYGTMADYSETVILATYGKLFKISRQAIINDDLGAFSMVPRKMGRAARRTVGNLVYAILNSNPAMGDGVTLFHADHANLGTTGKPSELTINEAITLMATQRDRSDNATALNIAPRFLIAPPSLRSVVLQTLNSEYAPDDTAKAGTTKQPYAFNTVRDAAEPIFDARLTGTAWYMAADPAQHDTIEVSYLDGNSQPFMEQQDGWSVDGTEFKVRIDAAAKALAWETLFKNAGA